MFVNLIIGPCLLFIFLTFQICGFKAGGGLFSQKINVINQFDSIRINKNNWISQLKSYKLTTNLYESLQIEKWITFIQILFNLNNFINNWFNLIINRFIYQISRLGKGQFLWIFSICCNGSILFCNIHPILLIFTICKRCTFEWNWLLSRVKAGSNCSLISDMGF